MCNLYNPDNVFKKFKVIEFPVSFVGLSTTQDVNVETDLNTRAYLKTMHNGSLINFKNAREISASHRAFDITQINSNVIKITFNPQTECISAAKSKKKYDNRFVFDLRLIKVDGVSCCNKELHSEIARYYISGQFEFCKISHHPKIIDFGDVFMNTTIKKHLRIRNESNVIAANIQYARISGFDVVPEKFTILPNSSKRICVSVKPNHLKISNTLLFKIKNSHNNFNESCGKDNIDSNYIKYPIFIQINVTILKRFKEEKIESMHKLIERDKKHAYLNEELLIFQKRKETAYQQLQVCKSRNAKLPLAKNFSSKKEICWLDTQVKPSSPEDFCKEICQELTPCDLLNILFLPYSINFGRVGLFTCGKQELIIRNNTHLDLSIQLLKDECILYSDNKLTNTIIKVKSSAEIIVNIFCLGFIEGNYKGTFEYIIDSKFHKKHPYCLQVGNPTLMIQEKCLKFGMVTTDTFITSVPIRVCNYFNITVDFKWDDMHSDIPFKIIPNAGSIPEHGCKICDVIYSFKPTKTKNHEIDFISESKTIKIVPIELSIITRKLSIKFLHSAVVFKDIALNLETTERINLENSSREIAFFHIVEPLIPGLKIEPLNGIIRPKTIVTFEITVKISCILEFAFDVCLKIDNKETLMLPVSGNVIEPKIIIHPKHIYMARIPCFMITYVPLTFQNLSTLRTEVEVLDTGDENVFEVYIAHGNEKHKISHFCIDGGQAKTVFIKVCDIFCREYEMYLPFRLNSLIGPPNHNSGTTELQHYIGKYEQYYVNNSKVKLKTVNKDISYSRIAGVITGPWILISTDKFEIEYVPLGSNTINFTISNVSKYNLFITIITSKISPNFSLNLNTKDNQSINNETNIKLELDRGKEALFTLEFHPKSHGKFVATALLFLDKQMTIPYYNLTFFGKRQATVMFPSTARIIFPPCYVGTEVKRIIPITIEGISDMDSFRCVSKEEPNLSVKFTELNVVGDHDETHTILTVEIKVCCQVTYARNLTLCCQHECGSSCDVEVNFCFTYCALTLHANNFVPPTENPYPYFPLNTQSVFYEYMDTCSIFLENWMFQQGFRRDLHPIIPDTFHAISSAISSHQSGSQTKGINVSFLNYIRRIAGPLMKHIRKISVHGVDESFKSVKEIHDTYREIINLLKSRGANLLVLKAKFLLSYEQYVIYSENVTPKCNADILLNQELLSDSNLFKRLNKQSWFDFILQSYKVFIMDSCFFECVCLSSQPRDIVKVIVDWYNEHIIIQHNKLRGKSKAVKVVTNITTDLSDGIAIASTILNYCPFLEDHFSIFCEVELNAKEGAIINNACLIIEAMRQLRLYFPLISKDFLHPNFLQMLFLSIHLYVTLPMFKPKDTIKFNPPLLRSSTRQVAICASSQELLIFNYMLLNNNGNTFIIEKSASGDTGKKNFISVKYTANFIHEESGILLVHGYNKTRIFDTYIVFLLLGQVGVLSPFRKCKVTGSLYRPNKVDVVVSSPFPASASYKIYISDSEPTMPVEFEDSNKPRFFLRQLNLIDKDITLSGLPKESGQEVQEHKLHLKLICLSTRVGNTWLWFRSSIGEFFIRVTTQPRWDLAIDTLQAKVQTWPPDPCSCGETCECYRTTILMIPHRNELMIKSLRYALLENASDIMMQIFDQLIETPTGKIILGMLLTEGGTNMSDVQHILRNETTFRISSRCLLPQLDHVSLCQHTGAVLPLPVTIPANDKSEKYYIIFTSDCGMDIRTYRVVFEENGQMSEAYVFDAL